MSETRKYNPKLDKGPRRSGKFKFTDVENPISLEIKDSEDLLKVFEKYPFIPYASFEKSSAQSLLYFLNSARYISGTQGACHNNIRNYCIGGGLDLCYMEDKDFIFQQEEDVEVPLNVKKEVIQLIREYTSEIDFTKLLESMFDSYKDNGNIVVELVHSEALGSKKSSITVHNLETLMYVDDKRQLIAISPKFDLIYLEKNPPTILPVYPNYIKDDLGYRTLIHIKNGSFKYFGRPDWVAAFSAVYREYQDSDYLIKTTNSNFTGQVFIEISEDDPETGGFDENEAIDEGYDSLIDKIEENFTIKADEPQTVLVTTRPFGADPAYIYQFKPNTNETYFKFTDEINRRKIYENNQWSEKLLGANGGNYLSSSDLLQEIKLKEASVLPNLRQKFEMALNIFKQEIFKFNGNTKHKDVNFYIKSSIETLLNEAINADNDSMGSNKTRPTPERISGR